MFKSCVLALDTNYSVFLVVCERFSVDTQKSVTLLSRSLLRFLRDRSIFELFSDLCSSVVVGE